MSAAPPTVTVVVPTLDRADRLARHLAEVLENVAPAEVVVVDDGSSDATATVLARLAASEPRLHPVSHTNRGQVLSFVHGAERAPGDVVLLLDDDVVPAPGIVAAHAAAHAEQDDLVLVGYMPVTAAETRAGTWPRDWYSESYERHVRGWEAAPETVLSSLWCGHLSIRRERLTDLRDALAGASRGYHRDLDFGLCAQAAGLRGRFDRRLGSRHDMERSTGAFWRNAVSSGASRAEIRARHPGSARPVFAQPLPLLLRVALRRRRLRGAARLGFSAAIVALGAAGRYADQRRLAGLGWRFMQTYSYARRSAQLGIRP